MPAFAGHTVRRELFCKGCNETFVHYAKVNKSKIYCDACLAKKNSESAKIRRLKKKGGD
jgi:formylmethanofuran dehydrogenase subunit E